jgi:Zn-dependent protease/predicted transcriptional regulator
MHNSFSIGKIKNIEIKIHYSWFLILVLIIWSLAEFYFPSQYPDWGQWTYWVSASIAAFLLFFSVLFHEFSHSLVGRRSKIIVKSITLFVFGGVAEMLTEPKKPGAEFKMAAAGPIASFFLAGVFWIISRMPIGLTGAAISYYLFLINGILATFNLVPAFPLDGGRIFRSILWVKYRDLGRATRQAVKVSKLFVLFLIFWGIEMFFENNFLSGIWMMFLGWFLYQAAEGSLRGRLIEETLSRVKITEIMDTGFKSVDSKITLDKLADFFLLYKQGGFPVTENGKIAGMVTLEDIREVPRKKWSETKVNEIMTKVENLQILRLADNAYDAFLKMTNYDLGRLPVVDDGKIVGLVTRNSIIFVLAVKCEKCI